jgi:hypothetical protein
MLALGLGAVLYGCTPASGPWRPAGCAWPGATHGAGGERHAGCRERDGVMCEKSIGAFQAASRS